jgi:hypothetical protein
MLKRRPGPEAARVAAKRGHSVVLVERQERVGGQLNLRAALPDREIFGITPEWYERQLRQLNVDVRLNTEATADLIMAEEPGAIQDGHRFARTVGEPNAPRTFADLYFAPVDFSTFRRPGSVLLAPSGYRLGTNDLDCGAEHVVLRGLLPGASGHIRWPDRWDALSRLAGRLSASLRQRGGLGAGCPARGCGGLRGLTGPSGVLLTTA